jgi:nicotinamide-nucleotide amidase
MAETAFRPPFVAELLSVGTELLLGEIVDTNSAWLAQDLARRGVDTYWSQRVGDNVGRISKAIEQALSRSDLLLMCGGLGPTDDDMSREAIAQVLGETPTVDKALEAELRARFATFSRSMPAKNIKQAWLIPSAQALPNPHGTAPGWLVRTKHLGKDKLIVALPGPPRELRRMWSQEAAPRLELSEAALFTKTFKVLGIGESAVAERLGELTLQANPSVATYAKNDGVHVRVAAKAESQSEARALAQPALERVRRELERFVWGEDEDRLEALICHHLGERGQTLATIESVSGGWLSEQLTAAPGASKYYRGGMVAYSRQAKMAFGVPEGLLEAHGSVSAEAAQAMAEAAKELLNTDYALATTGVAGPAEYEDHPVGEAYVAVCGPEGDAARSLKLPPGERDYVRERVVYTALSLLWSQLRG